MFRNKGYYWVKMFDKWQVAGWNGKAWYFTGTEESAIDSEIEKIGERVVRPDAETATLDIPLVSGSLLPTTLMRIHPELTYSEAESLMEFAKSHTITHEECYGNGSIIYPMWKEANYR